MLRVEAIEQAECPAPQQFGTFHSQLSLLFFKNLKAFYPGVAGGTLTTGLELRCAATGDRRYI